MFQVEFGTVLLCFRDSGIGKEAKLMADLEIQKCCNVVMQNILSQFLF